MRVHAIGVKRMGGVGKESGRQFDFAQIEILRPLEVVANEKFRLSGYGYETTKLDLANEAMAKFADVRFPAVLDLEVDTQPGRNGLRSVVVGFTRAADLKTAA
jgi:hypothetical protein